MRARFVVFYTFATNCWNNCFNFQAFPNKMFKYCEICYGIYQIAALALYGRGGRGKVCICVASLVQMCIIYARWHLVEVNIK